MNGWYNIGGVRYPSITTILGRMLPHDGLEGWRKRNRNWKELASEAAFNGALMHTRILQRISGTTIEIQDNLLNREWTVATLEEMECREEQWNTLGIEARRPIMVEHTVHFSRVVDDVAVLAAGTTDYWGGAAIMKMDAGKIVMDLKSSKKPQRSHELQLGGYALGLWREGKECDMGAIPYVRRDSAELVLLEKEELVDRSEAFLDVARRFYLTGQK